jgi:hypothetical protein
LSGQIATERETERFDLVYRRRECPGPPLHLRPPPRE